MNPRICVCCGEPMTESGGALSRNPNICASCSSMVDGMDEPLPVTDVPEPVHRPIKQPAETEAEASRAESPRERERAAMRQ